MNKLNIKRILEQVGGDEREFAKEIHISLEELQTYINGTAQPNAELFVLIMKHTGLLPDEITCGKEITAMGIDSLEDTWKPSKIAQNNLVEYLKQGLIDNTLQEDIVQQEISNVEQCVRNLRKPKISFAGQSDTGKSTLINALLCAEKMPSNWTPTTSIIVYIKHIQDRPSFIKEDVCIFKKQGSEHWNDKKLQDKEYCEKFMLAKGDFSLLKSYGTHQGGKGDNEEASSAVAFIDSPLLLDCDILDLPGFAATKEDDALHEFNTQENVTDILIYLSRANGFLQDRDLDYINLCLNSLRPIENKENDINKLENLFIIASQAGTINGGNKSQLDEILTNRCYALCNTLKKTPNTSETLLPIRSEQTGYSYSEGDFRKRFYTYEKTAPRLCKDFIIEFKVLAQKLPKTFFNDFCNNLNNIVIDSSSIIKKRIAEYQTMMNEREKYYELFRNITDKEPARKVQQDEKNRGILKFIDNLQIETKQEIETMYNNQMTESELIHLIDSYNYKNKKGDKEEFLTLINNILTDNIHKILKKKSDIYSEKLKNHLTEYSNSFSDYQSNADVDIIFDTNKSFAIGLAGLGALGASAAWLATSFTAWSVAILGPLASWGSILAVGGAVGLAIGGIIAGVVFIAKMFTWKKDLANLIIKTYNSEHQLTKIFDEVETYWSDTQNSFSLASEHVEEDWKKKLEEYKALGDEKNLIELKEKLMIAKRGLDFFIKIPMPENG